MYANFIVNIYRSFTEFYSTMLLVVQNAAQWDEDEMMDIDWLDPDFCHPWDGYQHLLTLRLLITTIVFFNP